MARVWLALDPRGTLRARRRSAGLMDADLEFEHLGGIELGERLVVADLHYVPSAFADIEHPAGPALQLGLDLLPGPWHVMVAREAGEPRVLLLCHESELDAAGELEHAERLGMIRMVSGRLLLVDAEICDDIRLRTQLPLVDESELPAIVLDAGVAAVAEPGMAYAVLTSEGRRKTVVFVVLSAD